MKKLLILALCLFTLTGYSQTVVVCNGNYAYSWHGTPNCRGLSNCQGGLYNVDLSYAVYTMNRRGCCICTNDPNCLTDRTDPAYVPSPVPFQPDWQFLEYAQNSLANQFNERFSLIEGKVERIKNTIYYLKKYSYLFSSEHQEKFYAGIKQWNKQLTTLAESDANVSFGTNYASTLQSINNFENFFSSFFSIIQSIKAKKVEDIQYLTSLNLTEGEDMLFTLKCVVTDEDIHLRIPGGSYSGYFLELSTDRDENSIFPCEAVVDDSTHEIKILKINGVEFSTTSNPLCGAHFTYFDSTHGVFLPKDLIIYWKTFDAMYRDINYCP